MTVFQLIALPVVALLLLRSAARFLRGDGPRRINALAFAVWLAVAATIRDPSLTTAVARMLGIGRGADLLLYLLTLAFLGALFVVYQRLRTLDSNLTEVVRQLALRDAEARWPEGRDPDEHTGAAGEED